MKKLTTSAVLAMGLVTSAIAQENPYKPEESIPELIETELSTHKNVIEKCKAVVTYALDEKTITKDKAFECSNAVSEHFISVDPLMRYALYELTPQNDTQATFIDKMKALDVLYCMNPIQTYAQALIRWEEDGTELSDQEKYEQAYYITNLVYTCYGSAHINANSELSEVFNLNLFPKSNLQDVYNRTFCLGTLFYNDEQIRELDREGCRELLRGPKAH